MPDTYVREIGRVEDLDGAHLSVGADYDVVTIGLYRFTGDSLELFARLFNAAMWAAGYNKARMEQEAGEAVGETIEALRIRLAGDNA